MRIYISAIGSGHTLNYPHQHNFQGVLGFALKTDDRGTVYKDVDQLEIFKSKFENTKYKYLKRVDTNVNESIFKIGSDIIDEMDFIREKFPTAKFTIEISPGYKRFGSILTLVSYIRNECIESLTFSKYEDSIEILPIIKLELEKRKKEILLNYSKGFDERWIGKINSNKYIREYNGDRKYLYKVIANAKKMGFINPKDNKFTEFGKLYLKYCC